MFRAEQGSVFMSTEPEKEPAILPDWERWIIQGNQGVVPDTLPDKSNQEQMTREWFNYFMKNINKL
jgi:hypothetical protein